VAVPSPDPQSPAGSAREVELLTLGKASGSAGAPGWSAARAVDDRLRVREQAPNKPMKLTVACGARSLSACS